MIEKCIMAFLSIFFISTVSHANSDVLDTLGKMLSDEIDAIHVLVNQKNHELDSQSLYISINETYGQIIELQNAIIEKQRFLAARAMSDNSDDTSQTILSGKTDKLEVLNAELRRLSMYMSRNEKSKEIVQEQLRIIQLQASVIKQ